jgi:FtsZ-binding cell division protein ZapB
MTEIIPKTESGELERVRALLSTANDHITRLDAGIVSLVEERDDLQIDISRQRMSAAALSSENAELREALTKIVEAYEGGALCVSSWEIGDEKAVWPWHVEFFGRARALLSSTKGDGA